MYRQWKSHQACPLLQCSQEQWCRWVLAGIHRIEHHVSCSTTGIPLTTATAPVQEAVMVPGPPSTYHTIKTYTCMCSNKCGRPLYRLPPSSPQVRGLLIVPDAIAVKCGVYALVARSLGHVMTTVVSRLNDFISSMLFSSTISLLLNYRHLCNPVTVVGGVSCTAMDCTVSSISLIVVSLGCSLPWSTSHGGMSFIPGMR